MKNILQFGTLFSLLIIKSCFGCPYIINNDSDSPVIIVDPYNKQAIHINPGNEGEIDPSIHGWQYYFYREKLDIYAPRKDNPHLFYRRYQLEEKYCTDGKTNLALTDIFQFTQKPSDRFSTTEFSAHEQKIHTH